MGDIGQPVRYVEFEPLDAPSPEQEPEFEPTPEEQPAESVPEEEGVPA